MGILGAFRWFILLQILWLSLCVTRSNSQGLKTLTACQLQGQCCNMATSNCCTGGGGGCYTTWERVCDGENVPDPQCTTVGKQVCIPISSTSCRTVKERIYRNYQVSHCAQRPLRKCFKYKKSVCVAKEVLSSQVVSWVNERLVLNNATNIKKCFDVQSMECTPREGSKAVRVPVQRTRQVPSKNPKCSFQTVRGKDKVVQVPVTEIVNRRLCWNVPETKCLNKRISCGAPCPQGMPCPSPAFQESKRVCPLNVAGGGNCFDVSPPSCGVNSCPGFPTGGKPFLPSTGTDVGGYEEVDLRPNMGGGGMVSDFGGGSMTGGGGMISDFGGGSMTGGGGMVSDFGGGSMTGGGGMISDFGGGSMTGGGGMVSDFGGGSMIGGGGMITNVGGSGSLGQLCCRQVMRNICRQVPTRVTKLVSKVVPGKVGYKRVCKDVVDMVPQTFWDQELQYVNYTRNECRPTVKKECINLTVRTFDVKSENVSNTVSVHLPQCEHKEVDAEYCHTFPTGNIVCRNSTVPKSFNLHKIKCDVKQSSKQCGTIPIMDCKNTVSPNNTCRLVPKTVCPQPGACKSDGLCGTCDAFRRGSGFGSCPGSNCPVYAASDNWSNQKSADNFISTLNDLPPEALSSSFNAEGYPTGYPLQNDFLGGPMESMPRGKV